VSKNHPKSSPQRSVLLFLGFFCTQSTRTAERTKALEGFLLLAHPNGLDDVDDGVGGLVLAYSH